jgi:predicted Rossmann fold flavoprotein
MKQFPRQEKWDVAVIGGGPAGMMAAGRAAELGARVILIEKNSTLGKKLLITGGGRCNITNAEFDTREFLSKFKEASKFLFSPFSQFAVQDTFDFFQKKGMRIKTEAEKRAFPESDSAQSVWDVLVEYLKKGKVTILSDSPVTGFEIKDKKITGVRIENSIKNHAEDAKDYRQIIQANSYILATGGKSRPETGSTGDGFEWLKSIGHKTIESDSALVPIAIRETWVKKLSGLSFSNAKVTLFQNNVKQESKEGKILFTHVGLSGPAILNLSKDIGELLKYGEVVLSLDIQADLDYGELDSKLQKLFSRNQNKKIKNVLSEIIPSALCPTILELSCLNGETFVNEFSRKDRLILGKHLKDLKMTVSGLLGAEKAIVTSGGVALEEIDLKTMQSLLYSNLYLIGDILNIDRPSGGYSLQLCWTTGYVAGSDAGVKSERKE